MQKLTCPIGLFILTFFGSSMAEQSEMRPHSLQFGVGLSYHQASDGMLSSLTYRGARFPTQLSYESKRSKDHSRLDIRLDMARDLHPSVTPSNALRLEDLLVDIGYVYHRRLANLRDKGRLYAGIGWENYLSKRKLFYDYGDSEIGGEGISSLAPAIRSEFTITRAHHLCYELSAAGIALVIRPPAGGGKSLQYDITSLNKLIRLRNEVSWEYQVMAAFSLDVSYHFEYLRYTQPSETRTVIEGFLFGCSFQL